MEGSAEDLAAPDSWEMADLDETMSRLLLSSRNTPVAVSSLPDLSNEAAPQVSPAPSSSSSSSSRERGREVSEEAIREVDQFLREALEKPRERLSILRMEQDIEKFIRDPAQQQLEFEALPTSYLRLAAHRVAQHYYLQSLALPDNSLPDGSGSRIVLRKTSYECRFPPVRLADIPVNLPQEDTNNVVKVAIKQRPEKHLHNNSKANAHSSKANHQKSVEERKEEYNKARARIFSSNNSSSSSTISKADDEPKFPHSIRCFSLDSSSIESSSLEGPEITHGRVLSHSSSGGNLSNRNKSDPEPQVSRHRASSRVAIFRDREVDRKDPDYDRSYDRYAQRFDPGFGFSGGPYTMQPLYSPAVNYNTEFPQLGSGQRPQITIEQQPRSIPQHLHGHWPAAQAPTAMGYGPPEGMVSPYNRSPIAASSTSSIYMPSSQYSVAPHHGMSFVRPHDRMQPFVQTHQQQPEASFGLARPR
ncbi:uncharacterized protein [Typha latifolia]|uniref:uncharacterized protein n=1 Tax=Typha latifolia TaxID=4733 RepID=UPI003C2BF03C